MMRLNCYGDCYKLSTGKLSYKLDISSELAGSHYKDCVIIAIKGLNAEQLSLPWSKNHSGRLIYGYFFSKW
jgi:hypothetical protein